VRQLVSHTDGSGNAERLARYRAVLADAEAEHARLLGEALPLTAGDVLAAIRAEVEAERQRTRDLVGKRIDAFAAVMARKWPRWRARCGRTTGTRRAAF
jgi:hypothetical protein